MKILKNLLTLSFLVFLIACSDHDINIQKPSTKEFKFKDYPIERYIGYFSMEEIIEIQEFDNEVDKLRDINPASYIYHDVPPNKDLIPQDFKYGDGSEITEAYIKLLSIYEDARQKAEVDYDNTLSKELKMIDSTAMASILKKTKFVEKMTYEYFKNHPDYSSSKNSYFKALRNYQYLFFLNRVGEKLEKIEDVKYDKISFNIKDGKPVIVVWDVLEGLSKLEIYAFNINELIVYKEKYKITGAVKLEHIMEASFFSMRKGKYENEASNWLWIIWVSEGFI